MHHITHKRNCQTFLQGVFDYVIFHFRRLNLTKEFLLKKKWEEKLTNQNVLMCAIDTLSNGQKMLNFLPTLFVNRINNCLLSFTVLYSQTHISTHTVLAVSYNKWNVNTEHHQWFPFKTRQFSMTLCCYSHWASNFNDIFTMRHKALYLFKWNHLPHGYIAVWQLTILGNKKWKKNRKEADLFEKKWIFFCSLNGKY